MVLLKTQQTLDSAYLIHLTSYHILILKITWNFLVFFVLFVHCYENISPVKVRLLPVLYAYMT